MNNIFIRLHVQADSAKFDKAVHPGAVCLEALRSLLKSMPGVAVPAASWGITERDADSQEVKELRHTVRKLEERVKELTQLLTPPTPVEEPPVIEEPTNETVLEEVVAEAEAVADVDQLDGASEPDAAEPEAGETKQRSRRRVR
jgi:hypothetical protein